MKTWLIALLMLTGATGGFAKTGDNSARAEVRNPIIWADVPDVSVLRVGDNYYMSYTTMHLNPGLPILKSRNLANWEPLGYAYKTLGDSDALALRNGKNAYGQGSWASSLRFHNGMYYVSTFSSTTGKTYVFSTKDIEKGEWTESSFRPSLHDSSLFFEDDGRVFMTTGSGDIWLKELNAGFSGLKPGGVNQVIIKNASRVAGENIGLPAEGSQIFKIGGKYYIFLITWPRGGMRTELVFRSDKLTGPYEGRVALSDRGIAQGGIVDTPDGRWYAMLFRDSGAVGRIPYLVPVTWQDGWPVFGVDGKVPEVLDIHAPASKIPRIVASDEFSRNEGDRPLPLVWQWNHNPENRYWSLTERPGFLRLKAGRLSGSLLDAQNSLTQKTFGPECSGSVALDVSNMKGGDCAGLAALQKNYGFAGVKMAGGARSIVMVNAAGGSPVEAANVPLAQTTVYLKIDMDFKDKADKAYFYYSLDGRKWHAIGKALRMTYTLPHFMGYRFALFNFATASTGGFVDFDYFRISDELERQHLE